MILSRRLSITNRADLTFVDRVFIHLSSSELLTISVFERTETPFCLEIYRHLTKLLLK